MPTDTGQQRLVTVRQAATELGVSKDWAYANLPLVRLGQGHGRGQVVRVRTTDVERLIDQRGGDAA